MHFTSTKLAFGAKKFEMVGMKIENSDIFPRITSYSKCQILREHTDRHSILYRLMVIEVEKGTVESACRYH